MVGQAYAKGDMVSQWEAEEEEAGDGGEDVAGHDYEGFMAMVWERREEDGGEIVDQGWGEGRERRERDCVWKWFEVGARWRRDGR